MSSAQVKTRSRFWMAGGVEGAGYGERAEFVYDGAKAGGRVGGGMAGLAVRRSQATGNVPNSSMMGRRSAY